MWIFRIALTIIHRPLIGLSIVHRDTTVRDHRFHLHLHALHHTLQKFNLKQMTRRTTPTDHVRHSNQRLYVSTTLKTDNLQHLQHNRRNDRNHRHQFRHHQHQHLHSRKQKIRNHQTHHNLIQLRVVQREVLSFQSQTTHPPAGESHRANLLERLHQTPQTQQRPLKTTPSSTRTPTKHSSTATRSTRR